MSACEIRQWRETTLGEIAEFMSGGTPSKDNAAYWTGSIPWVSAKDMKKFRLDDSIDHVSEEAVRGATKLVPANTVFLLTRGMTLLNDVPICVTRRPMAFNQDIKALRPRDGMVEDFLPYLLLGHKETLLNQVDLAGHGTGRLNTDELKSLGVLLPPEDQQRMIAAIFSKLDDKIELNRKMNETLEAMARALFKSWFVDFDPVRAKAEGSDTGLPTHIAALFPDSFEDSELGKIPAGWACSSLGELIELAYGKALKEEDRRIGTIPVFGSNGQIGWHDEKLVDGPGIVVGRKGNPGIVTWVSNDFFPIDTTFYVARREPNCSMHFLFFALQNQNLDSLSADSAVPGLNRNLAYLSKQAMPDRSLHKVFDQIVSPLFEKIEANNDGSRAFGNIRGALLPKLISGEIRLLSKNEA